MNNRSDDGRPVELPIDGTLDLHQFRPEDVGVVVPEYLKACLDHGVYEVRIIHGKGSGVLRRGVWALLETLPDVIDFHLAGHARGQWGATIVRLCRRNR